MNWCRKKLLHLNKSERLAYHLGTNALEKTYFPDSDSAFSVHRRVKYQEMANMCMNMELKDTYGLMAESNVVYCISNHETQEPGKEN